MSTNTATVDEAQVTIDKRIEQFITVRDKIRELKKRHEEELKPLDDVKNLLEGWLQAYLETAASQSVKTAHGTVYQTTRYTASLADPNAFMTFVIEKQLWELIDRKANAVAVREYVEEQGTLPPGCNLNALKTVGVRKPNGKATD